MNLKITSAVLVFCLFLPSCLRQEEEPLIDISAAQDIVPGERWALIIEPYAAYRIKPSFDSSISAHGRQGDIEKVSGTFIDINSSGEVQRYMWYRFSSGWLPEQTVRIYSNKLKAKSAAGNM